jgi:hypothetical protein
MVDPRINPATGLPWDDGDPNAPVMPAPVAFNEGSDLGGGGSAAPAPAPAPAPVAPAAATPAAQALFPPKPTYEDKTTVKTRVKSADDVAAEAQLAGAEGATDKAQHTMGLLNAAGADADAEGAGKLVDEKRAEIEAHDQAAKERAAMIARHQAADDAEIEQVKQARIAGTGAREHFFDGRAAAKIYSAVLSGISVAAEGVAGRSGPTPVQRAFDEQISNYEKAEMGKADALQAEHEQKSKGRANEAAESDRKAIERKNRALLSVDLIEDEVKAANAALGPDKAKAADALTTATANETRARLKQERGALYDKMIDRDVVNRSETSAGGAGANRQLSADTVDAATASADYDRMKKEQKEIIARNKGIPVYGDDATKFETNTYAMEAALQKQFGKSDNDAKLAARIQGSPGMAGKLWSKLSGTNTVDNYLAALESNGTRLKAHAENRIAVENKPSGAAASAVVNGQKPPPAAAAKPPTQDQKTWITQARLWLRFHGKEEKAADIRARLKELGVAE